MSSAVHDMFASIARRYDIANDVLSLGTHRFWRSRAVAACNPQPEHKILDVCCGTGDLAAALARATNDSATVVAVDFVEEMVELAKEKYSGRNISFSHADAMALPFADNLFDIVTVSFGIRNVDDPVVALREMNRVLRPGGTAMVLEFGQPTVPGYRETFNLYSKYVMPNIGAVLTGNRKAYEYLPETSRAFPAAEQFVALMNEAGFTGAKHSPLFGGTAYIYTGIAIETFGEREEERVA